MEAADRESGTPRIDLLIQSQAWLAQTLSALGAFAEGRRHGEEALRLATLEGREDMPILAHCCLGRLYLAQGDLEHAIRVLEQGLALCRASGNRTLLRPIVAGLGYAYALQGRLAEGRALLEEAISESIRTGGLLDLPSGSHGSARSVVWRDAARRPGSTPARRLTWPGSRRNAGTRRSRCTSLALSTRTPTLPMPSRPKPTTSRPWPWPRSWVCARSWPTATRAWARYIPDRPAGAGPCRAGHRHRAVPGHGHDVLAAPGRGRPGAGGGPVDMYRSQTPPKENLPYNP